MLGLRYGRLLWYVGSFLAVREPPLVMAHGLSSCDVWACPTVCEILASLISIRSWAPYIGSLES